VAAEVKEDSGSLDLESALAANYDRLSLGKRRVNDRLLTDKSKREMQHPLWTTGADDKARYGLGLSVTKVGEVDVFGHGGGYPGHITRTLVDPERRLVVSALTNAIDGPAAQLAEGLVRLLNLADSKDRVEEAGLGRFTGRFANLWGITDFVLLGGRLYATDPTLANPAEEPQELEADGDTLRVTGGNGYGSYGESYRFTFDANGAVESVRGSSGLTLHPIDTFTLPERVTVAE